MRYRICPECAYSTDDVTQDTCDYCKSDLLDCCPVCGQVFQEKGTIYCSRCGNKLRISWVPIQ
jgi:predicted amidophosphoribosyltransferase